MAKDTEKKPLRVTLRPRGERDQAESPAKSDKQDKKKSDEVKTDANAD